MTPAETRLRIVEALISKAPQSPDVLTLIERARIVEAYVTADTPQGPDRVKGTLSIVADTAKGPRKT